MELRLREALEPDQIRHLLEFIGYGRLKAPIWFIGMEESLGPRQGFIGWTPEAELLIRSQWPPVMDVKEAHTQLKDHYWKRRKYSQVWKSTAQVARGLLENAEDWGDTTKAHEYVVEQLGRSFGQTLLGDAMPLPVAGMSHWPYG
ncbi:MAG: hypothetical protein ACC700_15635, partial [Anaerolineales bacterium]